MGGACACVCVCVRARMCVCMHVCMSVGMIVLASMHEAWSGENRYQISTSRSEDNLEAPSSDDIQDMDISGQHLYA